MGTITRTAIVGKDHEVVLTGLPFETGMEVRVEIQTAVKARESAAIEETDLSQYAGSVELREDPLDFQRRIRAEWDR